MLLEHLLLACLCYSIVLWDFDGEVQNQHYCFSVECSPHSFEGYQSFTSWLGQNVLYIIFTKYHLTEQSNKYRK